MNRSIKNVLAVSTSLSITALSLYTTILEPTITEAQVTDNVVVTLNVTEGITISDGANVTMAPNISTAVNESVGGSSWVVTTNSNDGYNLSVTASTDEAMRNVASSTMQFADFNSGSATPTAWDTAKGSNIYTFGFSAHGTDTSTGSWGSGTSCGSGTVPTNLNYAGFATSTARTISSRTTVTPIAGITTNVCFAAEQVGVFAPSGTYTATVTGTAVVN